MVLLILKILMVWGVTAVTVGVGLGFLIKLADRAHNEELLNDIFASLSGGRVSQ